MTLSQSVISTDRKLENASSSASEALMEHRWHWTLDESNPKRVSIREYARAVGKSHVAITRDANAYVLVNAGVNTSEARERAMMGAETWAATEAVAKARGLQPKTVRMDRPVEIKRVREMARDRAEQHGTTVEEETRKAAQMIVRSEQAAEKEKNSRRKRLGLRFIELEEILQKMRREGVKAVNLAADIDWGDEERELLSATVTNVRSLIELVDLALVGAADIDWDAELAELEGSK